MECKCKTTYSSTMHKIIVNISRFDNNNRKLNNVMSITESINIDNYQANLKAFIQHYGTPQNGYYNSVIKKGKAL